MHLATSTIGAGIMTATILNRALMDMEATITIGMAMVGIRTIQVTTVVSATTVSHMVRLAMCPRRRRMSTYTISLRVPR